MIVLVTCLAFASLASAVTPITTAGTTIGGSEFRPSNGVTIRAISTTVSYCGVAQNSSSDTAKGGMQYATTSGSSTLVRKASTATATAPLTASDDCVDAGTVPTGFQ